MAKASKKEEIIVNEQEEKMYTIEQLAEQLNTPIAVLSGVKALRNWANGKEVSEREYRQAVKDFLEDPIGGKE